MEPADVMEPADLMVSVAPGVRLHVRHWPGDPVKAAFVLVHGLSSNARLWDGTAARLSPAGHQSYAVDLRSHGESERPPDGYDTDTAAADVAALIAGLALPAPVVAGQSWGGNVTVALAAKNPSGVRAVALLDGGWIDLRRQFDSWEACASALRPADIDGSAAAELASQVRRAHPDWAEWAIEATLANFAVDPSGRITRQLPIPQHMSILHSMWEHPPAPLFGSVTVPALLVPTRRNGVVAEAVAAIPVAMVREYGGQDVSGTTTGLHRDRLPREPLPCLVFGCASTHASAHVLTSSRWPTCSKRPWPRRRPAASGWPAKPASISRPRPTR